MYVFLCVYGWWVVVWGFGCLYFVCGLCFVMYLFIIEIEKGESDIDKGKDDEEFSSKILLFKNCLFLVFCLLIVVVVFSYYVFFVYIVSLLKWNNCICCKLNILIILS